MEAIESLAGMVSGMLDFPLVAFLGRMVPAGGSEAGQQVSLVRVDRVDDTFLSTIWPAVSRCHAAGGKLKFTFRDTAALLKQRLLFPRSVYDLYRGDEDRGDEVSLKSSTRSRVFGWSQFPLRTSHAKKHVEVLLVVFQKPRHGGRTLTLSGQEKIDIH